MIMKLKKNIKGLWFMRLFCTVAAVLSLHSCTDKYEEYNTNKSVMMEVGPKELAGLFSSALVKGNNWLTTDNMSRMASTIGMHFSGYTACGQTNQETLIMRAGWQNSGFKGIYSGGLPPLISIMDVTKDDNVAAYNVALIWKVFLLQRVTDLWGPVPYSQACKAQEKTPYDSEKDIYYQMLGELTSAVTALKAEVGKNSSLNVFGAGDLIYSGDVTKWIKFANTLRLRMAIRISNIDPDKAKAEAEAAIAAGAMLETNADDALQAVNGFTSNGNGMPRMESFHQDVMSTSMESIMKGYNDPRMQEYWSPVENTAVNQALAEEFRSNIGGYHGMTSGFELVYFTNFRAHSKYGPRFKDGNQYVTPINIMNAAETYFLKAEGAWRGWNMGGTAQSFYEKGIEISIKQWRGTSFSATAISDYINSSATPVAPGNYPYYDPALSNIPVKFSTDRTIQYEQIITQKWIALFPVCFEAWAEYRRTRLPKIYAKKYSANPNVNLSIGQIVTRLPYVDDEKAAQPEEVEKGVILLGGPDLETTPLWWDVNKNGN